MVQNIRKCQHGIIYLQSFIRWYLLIILLDFEFILIRKVVIKLQKKLCHHLVFVHNKNVLYFIFIINLSRMIYIVNLMLNG
ncbi:hypothetical protein RhiirB3_533097 [Rhizophagus irregularis]|nr:hypothetical protein RhiirB3_533097 [Rhizophagus irregularis]